MSAMDGLAPSRPTSPSHYVWPPSVHVSLRRAMTGGRDGLHCDPPSRALQSIFESSGRNFLAGLLLIPCNRALQRIGPLIRLAPRGTFLLGPVSSGRRPLRLRPGVVKLVD